ncbi:hypothetical protein NQ317_010575, partial [Molorchus minor]
FGNYKCFDDRHHWLILTSYRTFLNDFDNVTLYINANIQVIYPKENVSHVNNFTVEDVYNPSSNRGGILNHRTLGFYNKMEGYVAREKGCKYWIRRNMTGVTLKTIVVVSSGSKLSYHINQRSIEQATSTKFLGVGIDQKMTWEYHITQVASKLSTACFFLRQQDTVSLDILKLAYFGLVQSTLNYGLMFWGNSSHMHKAFIIQKKK